ncbi:MAG TPA: hypothetical protein VLA19_27035 [Herpetosiphonaceae bacterium]|nr:hypothetical protein [Herpetosiphonaceae bacterium]
MTTIPIEVQVSTEQLLQAVEQLPPQELASFAAQVLALRAQREASHVSSSETALLLRINHVLPAGLQRRFDQLVAKRQAETITADELHELIQITDQIEQHDGERLAALDALARLRGVTLGALMDSLGLQPPPYA